MTIPMRNFITEHGVDLELRLNDALYVSQPGVDATDATFEVSRLPYVARQLEAIDATLLRAELKSYGAWDDEQLADHDSNLQRLVWLAGCQIRDDER